MFKKTKENKEVYNKALNREKEYVHLIHTYAEMLEEVIDTINIKGLFIPLSDYFKRFRPLYADCFDSEQEQMIEDMKQKLTQKVEQAGFSPDNMNGYYVNMRGLQKEQDKEGIQIYLTDDRKYCFDTKDECGIFNHFRSEDRTVLIHHNKHVGEGTYTYTLLRYISNGNKVTAYIENDVVEISPIHKRKTILFKLVVNFDENCVKLYKKNAIKKDGDVGVVKKISDTGWYPYWKEAYVFMAGKYEFPKENTRGCVLDFICNHLKQQDEKAMLFKQKKE